MSERPEDPPDEDGPDGDADGDDDVPLSGLADRVRRSRSARERDRTRDPFADLEGDADLPSEADDVAGDGEEESTDPFEAMDVDAVDEESVWESLETEDPEVADQPEVGSGGDAERVEPSDSPVDVPEHLVQKTAYCQRCRFFSDPPDVRCTHEGTTIVEVVDSEHFRVRACPMVKHSGAGGVDPE